jgi:type III pantothenate kinase
MSDERLHAPTLIAVDVGNSRVKWGRFVDGMLTNVVSLPVADAAAHGRQIAAWNLLSPCDGAGSPTCLWAVASVNPDYSRPLVEWIRGRGFATTLELDNPEMLPLRVEVERPEAVGIDRLLDAVAANARRPAGRAAVIVDAGSAITVDAVSADGTFLGGAIAAGLGLSARALNEFTYWLPLIAVASAPEAVGRSTPDAMRSGLFWGIVGAINELVSRVAASLGGDPVVFLTGGDGELMAPHLARPVELVPELTLHGIYLANEHARTGRAN